MTLSLLKVVVVVVVSVVITIERPRYIQKKWRLNEESGKGGNERLGKQLRDGVESSLHR